MDHLTEGDLLLFAGALPERQAEVVDHLLACEGCRARAQPLLREIAPLETLVPPLAEAPAFELFWRRVLRRWNERAAALARERVAAGPLLEELVAKPAHERARLAAEDARFRTLPLVIALLERAEILGAADPPEAEALAALALTLVDVLPAATAPTGELRRDFQSLAWTVIGRSAGERRDWTAAELAFRTASDLLVEQESIEAALLARRLGTLRRMQSRALEAIALLQRAAVLFEACGDPAQQCLALEELGSLYAEQGELERAVPLLARAYLLAEHVADVETAWRGRIMLAEILIHLGRPVQAGALLEEAERRGPPPTHELAGQLMAVRGRFA